MLDIERFNNKMSDIIKRTMSLQHFSSDDSSDYLDYEFSDILIRESLDKKMMRENGCFFTGTSLAHHLFDGIKINNNTVFLDPTCGLGNLLLEASKLLPVRDGLRETLTVWGNKLVGYDIFKEFVHGAKLRIIFEALRRGAKINCSLECSIALLHRIKQTDVMKLTSEDVYDVTHAVLNPPFSPWDSPATHYWKRGKINSAGVITDHLIRLFKENTSIHAILPDVLRSGSRYDTFRKFIEANIDGKIEIWGRFSSKTDVDVFILEGKKSSEPNIYWETNNASTFTLFDHYTISTGPLVAYREPEIGPMVPYLHQKNAPTGMIIEKITEQRRFKGRLVTPPFVVVKRTSSPRDKIRASATIVNSIDPVAVENHLIIISPRDNSLEKCIKLMDILASQDTTDYLNSRIRLRHLTIDAIKNIPYI